MRKQFAIIGLGYFGQTIALELSRLDNDVLVIDLQETVINDIADRVTHAVIADASDDRVLRELNLQQYDAAVIAIGENIEASLLCTLHLKAIGVGEVWVKATNEQHHKLLIKMGATRIIHPELDMGIRIAQLLNYPLITNYFPLGANHFVLEMVVPDTMDGKLADEWLAENDSTAKLLAVKRKQALFEHPDRQFRLSTDDSMVLLGTLVELRKLTRLA